MNKQDVKKLALECGFKLKEQPDGSMDLNPYVYKFAEELVLKLGNSWLGEFKEMLSGYITDIEIAAAIIKNLNYEVKQWVKLKVGLR